MQSPSWDADSSSAVQETLNILRNPTVHHREYQPATRFPPETHKSNPRRPILFKVLLLLCSHLSLDPPSDLFLPDFPTKTPSLRTCHIPRPSHPPPITTVVFCVDYKSWSSTLCSFLHSPVTSYLLRPNVFLSTFSSNTLSLRSSLAAKDQYTNALCE